MKYVIGMALYYGGVWFLMLRFAMWVKRRYHRMVLWDPRVIPFIPMPIAPQRKPWAEAGAIAWPAPEIGTHVDPVLR